jgi:pSer/pThr/pTyr-binding forkhead associated (FHA) protein
MTAGSEARATTSDESPVPGVQARARQPLIVVLKSVSHPELADIVIEDRLFAIGRHEDPFASYDAQIMADLSRRHARLFWEGGALYVADLGSKNGTSINGAPVREKPCRLQEGDELRLGSDLAYRVKLVPRAVRPPPAGMLPGLTLTPERDDLGLQPIVITQFPFLIRKADEAFARYKEAYPHQVNYLSRRHAHIFLKGGAPFVEDLGSTNGTFVGGSRLDEHAVALKDGDRLAFGGNHFAYTVSLQREAESEPTLTQVVLPAAAAEAAPSAAPEQASSDLHADKTTFVATADSFLDIFCVDPAPQQDEVNAEAAPAAQEAPSGRRRRRRSRAGIFLNEIGKAFAGGERGAAKRALKWAIPVLALLVAGVIGLYLSDADERQIKDLVAEGQFAQAAAVADEFLAEHPDHAAVKKLGTEALLKARLPEWLASVKARSFDRAAALLSEMQSGARHNPDARALLGELAWIGELAQFTAGRPADAPIRLYGDEARIKALLQGWNDDPKARQKAFTQIAVQVPQFWEVHTEALSQLRRLESDESVYLAAIDRLNTSIDTELAAGRPEALEQLFRDYAEKYPRLAGVDVLRQDLGHYIELERAVRERRLGAIAILAQKAQFATPPFQARFRELAATRLPAPDVLNRYRAASQAWRHGKAEEAFAGLKAITGSWADAAASDLARKEAVLQQFKELQQARGGKGYEERLLAFCAGAETGEDDYFIKAAESEVSANRGQALARARDLAARAQELWRQYRNAGGIGGEQRLDPGISSAFRSQAKLLAEAWAGAGQSVRIYQLLKAEEAAQTVKLRDEIAAEAELQRRALQDLAAALAPGVLKDKLALIGGKRDEARKSP